MNIVSKDLEIQEKLIVLYEELENHMYDLRNHISGYSFNAQQSKNTESLRVELQNDLLDVYQFLFHKLDIVTSLHEIISDYRDCNGVFQDYQDMLQQIEEIMFKHAENEQFESAAVIKKWFDRIDTAISSG